MYGIEAPPDGGSPVPESPEIRLRYGIELPPDGEQIGPEIPDIHPLYGIETPPDGGRVAPEPPDIHPLYGIEPPADGGHLEPELPDTNQINGLKVDLADDVGYFSSKDESIRHRYAQSNRKSRQACHPYRRGCQAGKHVIGIRANGDISPCLSIRDPSFVDANIRHTVPQNLPK